MGLFGQFGWRWWFCWSVLHLAKLVVCLVSWRSFDLHPVPTITEDIIGGVVKRWGDGEFWDGYSVWYPVNSGVPPAQPRHSQDYLLFSKTKDHEFGGFPRFREKDVCLGLSSDGSFDVGCSTYIVCMNGFGKMLQGKVCFGQQANVNEISYSTTINEGSGFDDLGPGSQFDRKMNSSFIWQGY